MGGLTKSAVQSDENLTKISDTELEHLVRETINTVKQKPAHPQDQKPAEAQFADLLMKRVPTLLSSSHKTEKDLRDSLMQLHKKQPSDISKTRKLLGLPEYKKTSTKSQKEESHEKKENQEKNISTSDRGGGFLDIKLKPAKVTTEESGALTTVTKKLDADNEDDDYQIGTDKHFDDLTIMLKGMRLKPTVLEVYSKDKLAVSKKPGLKTVKKDDVDIFVDTFLKEIPDGNVTTNIDKNKFISKLSSLPSVSSISSDEMRNIISSVDPTLASEPLRQKYPELSNVKLEDTLKETIGHLRKHGLKNNKAPAKIQFAEVYLKSVPELVDSSSLSDTELLVNLSDMYERVPRD